MAKIHIFNASHDEALASNTACYTSSKAASVLEFDLASLPTWWADNGDFVLVPKGHELDGEVYNGCRLTSVPMWEKVSMIEPWGWDLAVVHRLKRLGAPLELLPAKEQIEKWRMLSSRKMSVKILEDVVRWNKGTIGQSWWVSEIKEIWSIFAEFSTLMFKSPWSSSGRGVFKVHESQVESMLPRIAGTIKRYGGIEVEPYYNRVMDLALEFFVRSTSIDYSGISVFKTSDNGAYAGNWVADEECLVHLLPDEIVATLSDVRKSMVSSLSRIYLNHYIGPIGVDMMIVNNHDKLYLHPCVEVNLRHTMGEVCLSLRDCIHQSLSVFRLQPVGASFQKKKCLTPGARKIEAILCEDIH